jgi:hypothetical protein
MTTPIVALLDQGLVYEHFSHHVAAYEATRIRIHRQAAAIVVEYEVFGTSGDGDGAVSKSVLRFDEIEFAAWLAALPEWERSRLERWARAKSPADDPLSGGEDPQ